MRSNSPGIAGDSTVPARPTPGPDDFNIVDIDFRFVEDGFVDRWIDFLSDEDLAFVKRFVLASGSLKELADAYGISYPTVRLRLDRLIERIRIYDSDKITSDFERALRAQHADGKIDLPTLKVLLAAHRKELEVSHATDDDADRGGAAAARGGGGGRARASR
jgi:hypothetical protein